MKSLLPLVVMALLLIGTRATAQDKCATYSIHQSYLSEHPDAVPVFQHQRNHLISSDEEYAKTKKKNGYQKTTAVVTIPVVFHVILTQAKLTWLGGEDGVRKRMVSQINSLNADYNRANADSILIPAPFKPNFGNAEIRFAPAHRTPQGTTTEGFEIKVTTNNTFSANSNFGSDPKSVTSGGLDHWQIPGIITNTYLNIWIVDIAEGGILGYTIPPSFISQGFNLWETGVVLDYGTFGARTPSIINFAPITNDLGRTATHEIGHFFEVEHTFGFNSSCPGSGDVDDGIVDTPPQAEETFSSPPGSCPPFPKTDVCTPSGNGIMWMNYMDYVDDACMHMFTNGQVNRMRAQLISGAPSFTLTNHPELLNWPNGIAETQKIALEISPNPASSLLHISFSNSKGLESISIVDGLGREVRNIIAGNGGISNYDVDLTGLTHGFYIVHCTFAEGTISRKIIVR